MRARARAAIREISMASEKARGGYGSVDEKIAREREIAREMCWRCGATVHGARADGGGGSELRAVLDFKEMEAA